MPTTYSNFLPTSFSFLALEFLFNGGSLSNTMLFFKIFPSSLVYCCIKLVQLLDSILLLVAFPLQSRADDDQERACSLLMDAGTENNDFQQLIYHENQYIYILKSEPLSMTVLCECNSKLFKY